MVMLTDKQAYAAMYYFLDKSWELDKEKLLAAILSDMALMNDDKPVDLALDGDWQEAINFALKGGEAEKFTLFTRGGPPLDK
jgi:hypothetical protein